MPQTSDWKILVAEDDAGLNRLICKKLEQLGYGTVSAHNGNDVMNFIEKESSDLMLLDYQMPGITGAEIAQLLIDRNYQIPFIVITGHGDERIAVEMMKLGAIDYLVKDTEFHTILPQKVKQCLKHLEIRKELEESRRQIAESEERYRLMAENSVDAIWQMDRRMKFLYISKAVETILGYSPVEFIGKHLWNFTSRIEFIKMGRNALSAIKSKDSFTNIIFESKMIHKNGHLVDVEITGKLLKDAAGKVIGFQGATRDITERVKSRERMSYQANLITTLINNIPDQIYVKDQDSRYLLNNVAHQLRLGAKSREELIGKTDYDFFEKELADGFRSDEEKVLFNDVSIINKEEYTDRDGDQKWALTTKVPLKDEKGIIVGLAGINKDITDRKAQEEELIRSRYELAVKNKISNIFLIDDHSSVYSKLLNTILNELSARGGFIGYLLNENRLQIAAESMDLNPLTSNKDTGNKIPKENWQGIWGKALVNGSSIIKNEGIKLPDDHIQIQNAIAVPIKLGDKSIGVIAAINRMGGFSNINLRTLEGLAGYIAPILEAMIKEQSMREEKEKAFSELKIAVEKAEESNRLKSAFLLNLSHELRTPLNSIMGFSSIIANTYKADEKTRRFTNLINKAGNDLIKLVEDTIDISKLESKELNVKKSKNDFATIMDELHREFRETFRQKYPDIDYQYVRNGKSADVNIDPRSFRKALINVMDNAAKFTDKGEVILEWKVLDEMLAVSVKDTGIGIPEELNEAVFEKFRKVVDKNNLFRGNGLGLSISKGLIEAMDCKIFLNSKLGEGTTVHIQIPLEKK